MTTKAKIKPAGFLDSIAIPGNRVGVLLVHSLGSSPMELRPLANVFSRAGCTVSCPMVPGMADGTDITSLSRWMDWYEPIEKAHDKLRETCDIVFVAGLSVGGMLAARLAARRPDSVNGLLLFAPIMWPNGWAIPWYFHFFRLVTTQWFARLFTLRLRTPFGIKDERIRRFVIDSLTSEGRSTDDLFNRSGNMVLQMRRLSAQVRPMLGAIRQPVAIFHPRHDDQSHVSIVGTLQARLGGMVESYVLDDCFHRVTLDRQRSFVEDRSLDFTARVTRQIDAAAAMARIRESSNTASSAAAE